MFQTLSSEWFVGAPEILPFGYVDREGYGFEGTNTYQVGFGRVTGLFLLSGAFHP